MGVQMSGRGVSGPDSPTAGECHVTQAKENPEEQETGRATVQSPCFLLQPYGSGPGSAKLPGSFNTMVGMGQGAHHWDMCV